MRPWSPATRSLVVRAHFPSLLVLMFLASVYSIGKEATPLTILTAVGFAAMAALHFALLGPGKVGLAQVLIAGIVQVVMSGALVGGLVAASINGLPVISALLGVVGLLFGGFVVQCWNVHAPMVISTLATPDGCTVTTTTPYQPGMTITSSIKQS